MFSKSRTAEKNQPTVTLTKGTDTMQPHLHWQGPRCAKFTLLMFFNNKMCLSHSEPSFLLFRLLQHVSLLKTRPLWCHKGPLWYLSHRSFSGLFFSAECCKRRAHGGDVCSIWLRNWFCKAAPFGNQDSTDLWRHSNLHQLIKLSLIIFPSCWRHSLWPLVLGFQSSVSQLVGRDSKVGGGAVLIRSRLRGQFQFFIYL